MQSETYPRGEPPRISDFTLGRWIMRSAELQEIEYIVAGGSSFKERRASEDQFLVYFLTSIFSFIRERIINAIDNMKCFIYIEYEFDLNSIDINQFIEY